MKHLACLALAALPLVLSHEVAPAASPTRFCAGAKAILGKDLDLSAAVAATFGRPVYGAEKVDCIYPLKLLRFHDADVLLTLAAEPFEVCHGCAGELSAFVLERRPGRSRVAARFPAAGSFGSFGNPGRIEGITIGGDDALAIESGGVFQGYGSTSLSLLVFRDGRLTELTPALPLAANNAGAVSDEDAATKAIGIEGAWRIDPRATVTIDYAITHGTAKRQARASWMIEGNALKLHSGAVPPEFAAVGAQ